MSAPVVFPFGVEFQRGVLRLMLEDDSFCAMAVERFQPTYFDNPALSWIYDRIHSHWFEYQRPPSVVALYEYLRDLDPQIATQYQAVVIAIDQTPLTDPAFIADRTLDFIRRNLFVEGMEQVRQLYNNDNTDEAYDFWQKRADEVRQLNLGTIDRGWFFEEYPDRQKRREAYAAAMHHHTFSTGMPDLDQCLNGGLSLGELGLWIAKQKVGKSMLLAWFAFWAVRALRIPVLVTVHEGGREFWEDRLEAAFAFTITEVVRRGELDPGTHARLVAEYAELKRLLVIRGYTREESAWNANVLDLAAELKDLKMRHGFRPKMIVCDYADLLRSRDSGHLTETQHQTAAMRDLKTLCDRDDGYAIWTASQAQRLPAKADIDPNFLVRAEQVADAIGKVRIPDFYGSINRTVDEEQNREVRLLAEQYRHGRAGRVIHVKTDYDNGRFKQSVLSSYEAPPPPPEQLETSW